MSFQKIFTMYTKESNKSNVRLDSNIKFPVLFSEIFYFIKPTILYRDERQQNSESKFSLYTVRVR